MDCSLLNKAYDLVKARLMGNESEERSVAVAGVGLWVNLSGIKRK